MLTSRPLQRVRILQWLHEAGRDIRLGLRALWREPAFAAAIVIILTIGIGATAAMLSVLQGMVLRPLPYPRANELALVRSHRIAQNQFEGSSIANMQDWRRQAKAFAAMSAYRRTSVSYAVLTGTDEPMRVREGLVDATFFDVVGVRPLAGRTFSASDFENEEAVVILSEGVWSERFGRAADVVGRTIGIDGRTHVVIGIMPASFRLPTADTRLWRPLSVTGRWWRQAQAVRDADAFEVIGRLAPGAVMDDAAAELAGIAEGLRQQHESNRGLDVRVLPLVDSVVPWSVRRGIWAGVCQRAGAPRDRWHQHRRPLDRSRAAAAPRVRNQVRARRGALPPAPSARRRERQPVVCRGGAGRAARWRATAGRRRGRRPFGASSGGRDRPDGARHRPCHDRQPAGRGRGRKRSGTGRVAT